MMLLQNLTPFLFFSKLSKVLLPNMLSITFVSFMSSSVLNLVTSSEFTSTTFFKASSNFLSTLLTILSFTFQSFSSSSLYENFLKDLLTTSSCPWCWGSSSVGSCVFLRICLMKTSLVLMTITLAPLPSRRIFPYVALNDVLLFPFQPIDFPCWSFCKSKSENYLINLKVPPTCE